MKVGGDVSRRTRSLHVPPRSDGELAHGRRLPIERIRHLTERHAEDVVEEECRPLERGQAL